METQKTQFALSLYMLTLVVAFLAAAPFAIAYGALTGQAWIFSCRGQGYAPDNFLAYCMHPRFADYEHAAYLRGLEPEAVAALKAADVVTLGNSRGQMAFAEPAMVKYFTDRNLKIYMLGFGDGEAGDFARLLIERMDLRPRAVIINADYFFESGLSPSAEEALRSGWRADLVFALKRELQNVHPQLCKAYPWLCGDNRAVYRDRSTGMWSTQDYDRQTPAPLLGPDHVEHPKDMPALLTRAREYVAWLESRGTCVIITAVPSSRYDREASKALAQKLGRPMVFPEASGLAYYDTSHLTVDSAQRYMQAMYPALAAPLSACGL